MTSLVKMKAIKIVQRIVNKLEIILKLIKR
jgi:hypothetical protein